MNLGRICFVARLTQDGSGRRGRHLEAGRAPKAQVAVRKVQFNIRVK